jgi:hypothetical protein
MRTINSGVAAWAAVRAETGDYSVAVASKSDFGMRREVIAKFEPTAWKFEP